MAALVLSGIAASKGIAIGRARVIVAGSPEVPEYVLSSEQVPAEIERYRQAVAFARTELADLAQKVRGQLATELREFIDAHLLMLEDDMLAEGPLEYIRSRSVNAEWALKQTRDSLVAAFEAMDDDYLRSRLDDIDQVVSRIQGALAARQSREHLGEGGLEDTVIVADDLSPSDLAELAERGMIGLITESGGELSHCSILARALGLPYIAGIRQASQMINEGMTLIVDAERGITLIQPDAERLSRYRERQHEQARRRQQLRRLRGEPARTSDGVDIGLWANGETTQDLSLAVEQGADGIGLYRTEYLFLGRAEPPGEDEQYEQFVRALDQLEGRPLTIRTLDVGADKQVPLGQDPHEPNPALGLRGIRLSLRFPELLRTQLSAALRAARHGPVRLLLPMLTHVSEVVETRRMLEECRQALGDSVPLQLGGMVEVPAAALSIDAFLEQLDFVSIGTNDLVQYTLAVDRGNQALGRWHDPLHPAVIELIARVIAAGERHGKPVSLCGEMAGEARHTALLLALGLREFSMHPRVLLEVKDVLRTADIGVLAPLRDAILQCPDRASLRALLPSLPGSS
ncbi:MAG: phosphoenolpyruvate--protein phosphotransferase [Xanthomonadales bacterium]|nr:phosphoenolpyruvate--protein phosphotransferase [Xanthomonadales bacterium]